MQEISCREGDLELIKILLSKTIHNNYQKLQLKIDETNRTASLFNVYKDIEEVIIPRTVEHNSVEYLITSISGTLFKIKTLKFVEDSAVKTFYGFMFPVSSKIKEIYFPASLVELKDGWCSFTKKLTKIIISPKNDQFILKEDKYLIGKRNF